MTETTIGPAFLFMVCVRNEIRIQTIKTTRATTIISVCTDPRTGIVVLSHFAKLSKGSRSRNQFTTDEKKSKTSLFACNKHRFTFHFLLNEFSAKKDRKRPTLCALTVFLFSNGDGVCSLCCVPIRISGGLAVPCLKVLLLCYPTFTFVSGNPSTTLRSQYSRIRAFAPVSKRVIRIPIPVNHVLDSIFSFQVRFQSCEEQKGKETPPKCAFEQFFHFDKSFPTGEKGSVFATLPYARHNRTIISARSLR